MKQLLVVAAFAALLAGWLGVRQSWADEKRNGEGKTMFKAVVHVNFDDADRQKAGLKNVTNMLKEVKQGAIVVVCHGKGIGLLVKDKSSLAPEVAELSKAGVKFAACENTMREKSIKKEELLPGVSTVPSGAVEVVRRQQEGYGYFRP
jgi:uncharacterized protein